MLESKFVIKMDPEEEKAKKTLEEFLEKAKTIDDLNEIHSLIEDYFEQGYNVRDYLIKYNELVGEFNEKKS